MSISEQPPRRYTIDDRVVIDPTVAQPKHRGVVFVVTKILKVNVEITPEGGGRAGRINPVHLLPAPESGTAGPATQTPVEAPLSWGTVVRVDRAPAGRWRYPVEQLYVVVGDRDLGHRLARLGGDPDGRYFKSIPRGWLTEIPVEAINR